MRNDQRNKRLWTRGILLAWFCVITLSVLGEPLGRVEGMIWPVVREARITHITEDGRDVVFSGVADKRRECSFLSISWYVHDDNGLMTKVDLDLEEAEKVRPAAGFQWGPWRARVSAEDLSKRSVAIVRHRCHPIFDTTSVFYPPDRR